LTKYDLGASIGAGPLGQVFRGAVHEDPELPDGQPVAIKILNRQIADDARVLTALRDLGPVVRGLQHPNIVRVHRLDPNPDAVRIVSELVPGEGLSRLLGTGRPSPRLAAEIVRGVFAALAHLHQQGLVHGDLKLENVLIADEGGGRIRTVVTDVALAATLTRIVPGVPRVHPARAPEVVDGQPPGPAADLFAAGAILHLLLTGQAPIVADGTASLAPGVPESLRLLVTALLATRPDERPSAAEAEVTLQTFLPALSNEAPSSPPAPAPPPRPVSDQTTAIPPMPPVATAGGVSDRTRVITAGRTEPAAPAAPPPPPATPPAHVTAGIPAAPVSSAEAAAHRWRVSQPAGSITSADASEAGVPFESQGQRRRGGGMVLAILAVVALIAAVVAVLITRDTGDDGAAPVITSPPTATTAATAATTAVAPETTVAATTAAPAPTAPPAPVGPHAVGYWIVSSQGAVIPLGGALPTNAQPDPRTPRVVGAAPVATGGGFWLLYAEGTLRWFGDAFPGELPADAKTRTYAGLAATPSGQGLFVAAIDGTVFGFGDARGPGSGVAPVLAAPIVSIVASPTGQGFWMAGSDGGVLAYGDAQYHGGLAGSGSPSNIAGMARTPSGNGYWLVSNDGGIFAFGDAGFFGSLGSIGVQPTSPITSIAATPSGQGYWLLGADGGVFAFGDAAAASFDNAVGKLGPGDAAVAIVPRVVTG
jgi:serine/threonine protein kinase